MMEPFHFQVLGVLWIIAANTAIYKWLALLYSGVSLCFFFGSICLLPWGAP